jgi:hypothetical protein
MTIDTPSVKYAVTNSAMVTQALFGGFLPQTTKPSGDGVLPFGLGGFQASSGLRLVPFGIGSNGQDFSMNVYGWTEVLGDGPHVELWVPILLAQLSTITLDSSLTVVSGTLVNSSAYFSNSITLAIGNSGISVEVVAPGSPYIAHAVIDVKGHRLIQLDFAMGGSATSGNCLWAKM